MEKSRILAIIVFFRRNWWHFVLTFAVVGFVFWLFLVLPFKLLPKSSKKHSEVETTQVEDVEIPPVVNFPVVFIVSNNGVYTDIGFCTVGGVLGDFTLSGMDTRKKNLTWTNNNDGSTSVLNYGSNFFLRDLDKSR